MVHISKYREIYIYIICITYECHIHTHTDIYTHIHLYLALLKDTPEKYFPAVVDFRFGQSTVSLTQQIKDYGDFTVKHGDLPDLTRLGS